MQLRIFKLIVAAIIVMATSATATPTVYVSNPYTPGNTQSAYYSCEINGIPLNQCYTDVDYDGSYRITDFRWWGDYLGPSIIHFPGFQFEICASAADGRPGVPVYTEFFLNYDNLVIIDGPSGLGTKYGATLATPFAGAAGKYWFSVKAMIEAGPYYPYEKWGWTTSQTTRLGNDDWQRYGDYTNSPGSLLWQTPQPGDLTFEVLGEAVVPEPASLALFGFGLAGFLAAGASRRKRNSTFGSALLHAALPRTGRRDEGHSTGGKLS
jgi:hypothetical protein